MVRIAVKDRSRLRRESLALVLQGQQDIELVGTAETGAEMVALCHRERPDVVLIDADGDSAHAANLVRALREGCRDVRVVGISDTARRHHGRAGGFHSVVPRSAGIRGLLSAVVGEPADGGTPAAPPFVAPRSAVRTTDHARRAAPLTPRELDILRLIGTGAPSREIAAVLGITPKTVENHKQRIFCKLGVQNQSHAVSVAIRDNLLAPTVRRPAAG